jgi:hypothetical protein
LIRLGAAALSGAAAVLIVQNLRSPKSLAECRIRAVQEARNDQVAAYSIMACNDKFISVSHDLPKKEVQLNPVQLYLLSGRAGVDIGGSFGGTLYNGNRDVRVTSVEIKVKTREPSSEWRTYRTVVSLDPLTAGRFDFTVPEDPSVKLDWDIESAYGFPVSQ